MKYFQPIVDLPQLNLQAEMNEMLSEGLLDWGEFNQICINSVPGHTDDYNYGSNSLHYDWAKMTEVNGEMIVPEREHKLSEGDFTELCDVFAGTDFETIHNLLAGRYILGRTRLMRSLPKTCLTWHKDTTLRLHLPLKTQEGCYMVIEDEILHLAENRWWQTNTTKLHTAFNGSKEERIHLVAVILGER